MNQRLTRKEIKRDDFTSAVGRGVEYAESHVMTIVYAVAGVLVLVAIGVGIFYWRSHQSQAAGQALAKAVKVVQAPVVTTGAKPTDPTEPSFPTEEAHRAAAKKALQKVRDDYGSTNAAEIANLYLAQIAAEEGKLAEARKIWKDFADSHPKHMLGAEARLNLLHLDREQGKGEEVVKELRAMLEKGDNPVPQDVLLHELGSTLEQLKRPQEAVQSYQRILDEFPQSPYRQEAQQKVTALDPARAAGSALGGLQGIPGFPG
ncbi:MAG TPA: tetratricopeptide repeat protein [Thermoanaerobaculia bacterium]|nr:tetratricopeptide repeat protein [Thermoanaerobaculia bacterium]